jgi:hypothetical protein
MVWNLKANIRGIQGVQGFQGVQGLPGVNAVANDTATAGYISTAGTSATKTALTQALGVLALPPTGIAATDTANLQAAINLAQSTYGTVYLQAGTYVVTNLATAQSSNQPKIIGKGQNYTFIQGTTSGSALMIKGGSASDSGGHISDITFTGTGVGLELQGACFFTWERLNFAGTQTTGILLHNYASGEFTEYCSGQADFAYTVITALEYRVTSGNESFHGSGLTGQSTINQPATATSPSILIGAGCIPYNAPLDVTFWVRTATQALIRTSTARPATFHGTIRVETFTSGALVADATGAAIGAYLITHVGSVMTLGAASGAIKLGALGLAERAAAVTSGLDAVYKPSTEAVTVGPTEVALFSRLNLGGGSIMHVTLIGANYYYVYLLHVEQSIFDPTGVVTVLANPYSQNSATWGAPTFSVSGYKLKILNANYPAGAVTATTSWSQLGSMKLL